MNTESSDKFKSTLAFTDLLFNVLIGFAFLFIIAFILINPIEDTKQIESKAEFMIIMEWDDESVYDIDLWMQDPLKNIAGFPNKEAGWLHLDRDDLGQANDVVMMSDGQTKVMKRNREIMTVRGIVAGEYIVNSHFYSAKATPYKVEATDVRITVIKINPYLEVYSGMVTLTGPGDEETAIRFKVNEDGDVVSKNKLRKRLAGMHLDETNLHHSTHYESTHGLNYEQNK
tara:strand:- start:8077 stop:8763 length:687 start_codon:yes stop_codon:yes gene_type:complete